MCWSGGLCRKSSLALIMISVSCSPASLTMSWLLAGEPDDVLGHHLGLAVNTAKELNVVYHSPAPCSAGQAAPPRFGHDQCADVVDDLPIIFEHPGVSARRALAGRTPRISP